jgi:hypothetical protein
MDVKTGIAILIPRKKGEKIEEDELSMSPTNTQRPTLLDNRDSMKSVTFDNT